MADDLLSPAQIYAQAQLTLRMTELLTRVALTDGRTADRDQPVVLLNLTSPPDEQLASQVIQALATRRLSLVAHVPFAESPQLPLADGGVFEIHSTARL